MQVVVVQVGLKQAQVMDILVQVVLEVEVTVVTQQ
jgi:hypothetical protein